MRTRLLSTKLLRSTLTLTNIIINWTHYLFSDWSKAYSEFSKSARDVISADYTIIIKQLLDEVFVISRIIKVEVGVINRSRRLRLITLTEILIILDITRISSNDCFIIHWTKKMGVMFLLLQRFQATQSAWTWHDYPWPWGSCAWVLAWLSRECYVRNADNDVTDLQMTRTASQRKRGLWHGCMVALHRSKSPKVLI